MKTPQETTTRLPSWITAPPRPGTAPSLRRGASLGRYTVLEAIGSGGMGNVFSAYDPELRRRVAIKVLHGDLMRSGAKDVAQARLRKEAQATARLAHPNVVSIYDVGIVDQFLFIAMELLEGQTLSAWGAEQRPWREVLAAYLQAGQGLAAAHRAGLIHRDFKPSNVMVTTEGQVKILDFGLAKLRGAGNPGARQRSGEYAQPSEPTETARDDARGAAQALTITGQILGTPSYMSPEQLRGEPVGHRSDQFSFCVALFRGLYRTVPYSGANQGELARNLLAGNIQPPPRETEVPAWLLRPLRRGLSVKPEERYPSMDTLLEDLSADPTTGRRRRWGLAAVLAGAIVAAIFWLRSATETCGAGERYLVDVWSPAHRAALAGMFTADAGATWRQTAAGLEAHALRLRTMYTEVCEATHVRGEQSMELLDRRMTCLDDRRREFEALIQLFQQGRPEILVHAAQAVGGLPRVAACADRRALADLAPPPPEDEATAVAVDEIRNRLASVLALELAAKYQEALPLAKAALAEAIQTGYQPLVGEARLQLAKLVGRLGASEEMKKELVEAAAIAQATKHWELLARSFLQLIIVGYLEGDGEAARTFGRLAQGAIATLSGREDLEARRVFYLGLTAVGERRYTDAARDYETYLTIDPEITPLERVTALNNLAEARIGLGHLEEAREALVEAERWQEEIAPGHDAHAEILRNLGALSLRLGHHSEAETFFLRSAKIFNEAFGDDHPKVGLTLTGLAQVYLATERNSQAIQALESSLALHLNQPGYGENLAEVKWLLGRALWEQGTDRSRALTLIGQAASAINTSGQEQVAAQAAVWLLQHGGT